MGAVYTFAAALTELVLRLGNRNDLASRPTNWLNSAQLRLASSQVAMETLDVLGGAGSQLLTVANTSTYNLTSAPTSLTNIIGIMSIRNVGAGVRVRKFPWTDFRELNQQAVAAPLRWARWGNNIALDPQPDAVYTLTIDYRREPALGTIEVPNRFQEELLDLAEFYGWKSLQQYDKMAATFAAMPRSLQALASMPMDRDQWEAMYDVDLGIRPTGFAYPFTMGR